MPVTDAPIFTLYLAAPDGLAFTPAQEDAAMALVGARFASFTVIEASGVHEGRRLPTLLIQIADHDRAAVAALAAALARSFGQRWVGMSDGARYTSMPADEG
jgi:hypothetical protein